MIASKNNRRQRRIPYVAPIRISWEDHGIQRFATARCIDLCENGLRVEVTQPIQAGTRLQLGADRIKLRGGASVRRMERSGSKYLLGLELTETMPASVIAGLEGRPVVTVLIENFNKLDQKV
jgi:hypothetical protein